MCFSTLWLNSRLHQHQHQRIKVKASNQMDGAWFALFVLVYCLQTWAVINMYLVVVRVRVCECDLAGTSCAFVSGTTKMHIKSFKLVMSKDVGRRALRIFQNEGKNAKKRVHIRFESFFTGNHFLLIKKNPKWNTSFLSIVDGSDCYWCVWKVPKFRVNTQ